MPTRDALSNQLPQTFRRGRGELSSLVEMVPLSLDLFSPGLIARQAIELLSNAADRGRFLSVLTSAQSYLRPIDSVMRTALTHGGTTIAPAR